MVYIFYHLELTDDPRNEAKCFPVHRCLPLEPAKSLLFLVLTPSLLYFEKCASLPGFFQQPAVKMIDVRVGVNQDCWLLEYPWQFVLCRHVKYRSAGVLE